MKDIANLGLCIFVNDIRSIVGGFVFPGNSASTYTVEFRSVMFWLFAREIITARLKESDANGLRSICMSHEYALEVSFYDFVLKKSNFTRLCNTKSMLTVNESFPGPIIRIHRGDKVYVNVQNEGDTIHWKIAIRDWKCFHHFGGLYGNINEKTLDGPKQFSSFAKYTTIEEKLLALKPKILDFVQAAGLPRTIETTYDGLGRTGFSAVWCLKSRAATSSTGKLELMKSLGTDLAIDYTKEKFEDLAEKFNCDKAVKVVKEGGSVVALIGAVTPSGTT
ncbi:hypothetical protein AAG906_012991 [Vitis piasezkii]